MLLAESTIKQALAQGLVERCLDQEETTFTCGQFKVIVTTELVDSMAHKRELTIDECIDVCKQKENDSYDRLEKVMNDLYVLRG